MRPTKALAKYGRTEGISTFFLFCSSVSGWPFTYPLAHFRYACSAQAGFVVTIKILIFKVVQHLADKASIPVLRQCFTLYASRRQHLNSKATMTSKSFIFYLLILSIGSFLYLSVIFSYGLSAPLHVLIIWLMYDRFISTLKSDFIISKTTFAIIPCIVQNFLFFIYFISTGDLTFASIDDFYFSWIGLILILVTVLEFFILKNRYSKFIIKRCPT